MELEDLRGASTAELKAVRKKKAKKKRKAGTKKKSK